MRLRSNMLLATHSLQLLLTLPTLVVYLVIEHYAALFNAYMGYLHSEVSKYYIKPHFWACMSDEFNWPLTPHQTYIFARTVVLSIRFPSSSCSATSSTGKLSGIIRLGVDPGITEYLEKSDTPHFFRRKSSSVSRRPFTTLCGARSIARTASENIVCCSVSVLTQRC